MPPEKTPGPSHVVAAHDFQIVIKGRVEAMSEAQLDQLLPLAFSSTAWLQAHTAAIDIAVTAASGLILPRT